MSYKVKLDVFEGPFDLLVYLIERSGVDIYDVNISEITAQYVEYVRALGRIDPESAAEFMVLAATLLQIKSQMLLPGTKKTVPKQEREDPRDELAKKIREYKKYKMLAEKLRELEAKNGEIFTKPAEDLSEYAAYPREELKADPEEFMNAFRSFLERRRRIEEVRKRYEHVPQDLMTIEEKSQSVMDRLRSGGDIPFGDLLSEDGDLYDVVLTFTALLELTARGRVAVRQKELFGEITARRKRPGRGEREEGIVRGAQTDQT